MRVFDVAVIGAGPSGSCAAALLARDGFDVALIDRSFFPRDKVCGESVSPGARAVLHELGMDAVIDGAMSLDGMRVGAPSGTTFTGRYSSGRGFTLLRSELDAALLRTAQESSATFMPGCEVVAAAMDQDGARLQLRPSRTTTARDTLDARFIVIADGRDSFVARQLGLMSYETAHARFAIRLHLEGVSDLGRCGEMYVGNARYCGIAPLSETRANVSLVVDAHVLGDGVRANGSLEAFALQAVGEFPLLRDRVRNARPFGRTKAIGPLRLRPHARTLGRAFVAGDAGGFVDPFTGEGVTVALKTGRSAAQALSRVLRRTQSLGDASAEHERFWRRRTRRKFAVSAALQALIRKQNAANAVARFLRSNPWAANRLVRYFGDDL